MAYRPGPTEPWNEKTATSTIWEKTGLSVNRTYGGRVIQLLVPPDGSLPG